jgi:hypothetical protein
MVAHRMHAPEDSGELLHSYASIPMLRSVYRTRKGRSPWLSSDPELNADCSAAVRAFRLLLFMLFTLFVAPLKSHSTTLDEYPEAANLQSPVTHNQVCGRDITLSVSSSQNRVMWTPSASSPVILHGATQRALEEPKRDAPYLTVERDHGPPADKIHVLLPRPRVVPALCFSPSCSQKFHAKLDRSTDQVTDLPPTQLCRSATALLLEAEYHLATSLAVPQKENNYVTA